MFMMDGYVTGADHLFRIKLTGSQDQTVSALHSRDDCKDYSVSADSDDVSWRTRSQRHRSYDSAEINDETVQNVGYENISDGEQFNVCFLIKFII